MTAMPGRWRRLAVKLARHAASVLPGAPSLWADAMRRELDYIADDPAALRWALGCLLASYRVRLTDRPWFSAPPAWRQLATCGALMLLIALALQENAGGQTEPPRPVVEEAACDLSGATPESGAKIDFIDRPASTPDPTCADPGMPIRSLPKHRAP